MADELGTPGGALAGGAAPASAAGAPSGDTPQTPQNQGQPGEVQTPPVAAANPPASGAPEKYDWKAADGTPYEEAVINAFEPMARKYGLSQENASELLASMVDADRRAAEDRVQALDKARAEWAKEVKQDPVLGGTNFDTTMRTCNAVVDKYCPEAKDFLQTTGLGNHRVIVKMLHSFAQKTAEDTFATPPSNNSSGRLSREEVFYGAQK